MEWIAHIKRLLKIEIQEILHIPWKDIQFETLDIALVITGFLLLLLLFRKRWAKKDSSGNIQATRYNKRSSGK